MRAKQVWTSDHDFGDIVLIAEDFEDFIRQYLDVVDELRSDQQQT